MGIFDLLFGGSDDDEPKRDRYGNDRENSGGPKVKSGPNAGLVRAKNKDGAWRKKRKS
jgi:hypothetical protein